MRMAGRSVLGWALTLAAGAALVGAALELRRAVEERAAVEPAPREERVFTVAAAPLERVTVAPEIRAYGALRSWRTATLSAPVAGRVAEVSPDWRDGRRLAAGQVVLRIDPTDYAAAVEDAEVALAEAEADAAEARQSVSSAEIELDAARMQRDLRAATLERQRTLATRGVASAAAVDEAEIALAAAGQAVAGREQALLTARLRIGRADLAVRRAGLALEEAGRRLDETVVRAPFAGIADDVSVGLGDRLAANAGVGALIDPAAIEAALRVSGAEFGRLLDERGAVRPLEVAVTLDLGAKAVTVAGVLDRADASVAEGEAGRTVFARLDADPDTVLRPGDFVTGRIVEPALRDVAVVPAAAVTEDGRLLIVGAGERLEEATVAVLRRDGDAVVIAGAPFGALYVTARSPQLGPGVRVRAVAEGPAVSAAPDPRG